MSRKFLVALCMLASTFSILFASSQPVFANTRPRHIAPNLSSIIATPPVHLRLRHANSNDITPDALSPQGLTPSQIRSAYGLPSSGGTGTIALIEAYDNPNAESDLGVFDSQFSLPSCTTANSCFQKYQMASSTGTDSGWSLESSLDIQWAHAIAPNAKILVVEAQNSSLSNLLAAVNYARSRSDVVAVSMSWGNTEFSGESSYDGYFVSTYGAQFFASSGDSGTGVSWPAASPNVVSVGGTTLTLATSSVSSETAWSGSGGGVSAYETQPGFQSTYGIANSNGFRAVPDVSYDADPTTGFSVYDSTPYQGQSSWLVVGGTSAGAPQWAAIYALGHTATSPTLYGAASSTMAYPADFRDITSGTNGSCGTKCTAGVTYDYVTGLGSPLTTNFSLPTSYASITGATGATNVSIDTTSASGGTGAWTTISGPTITETASDQIASGVHTFTLPAGWQFNTGHSVSIALSGGTSLSVASTTITPSSTTLSFTVASSSMTGTSTLTFSGMQVRPTDTTTPSFGILTESGAAIAGVDGSTSFGPFATSAGQPVTMGVETAPDGSGSVQPSESLQSGTSTQMYSITRDQFGNVVANASTTWSLTSRTGGATSTDLVASGDNKSAIFTGHLIGSAIVTVSTPGLTSINSGTTTVTMGMPASLILSPATTTIAATANQTYTAQGTDAAGNSGDVTASTTFSIDPGAGGSFSANTYTAGNAGNWLVTGTDGGATATATIAILAAQTPPPQQSYGGGGGGGGGGGTNVSTTVTKTTTATSTVTLILKTPVGTTTIPAINTITTPTIPAYLFTRSLSVGAVGSDVTDLQKFLNTHGFVIADSGPGSPGNETDTFGGKTKLALAAFQSAHGISPASGYLGPKTIAFIATLSGNTSVTTSSVVSSSAILPSAVATASPATFTRNLSIGSTGSDVLTLQKFLITQKIGSAANALGVSGASGTFGPLTKAALAEYQTAVGISPTGYFGPSTRAYVSTHL